MCVCLKFFHGNFLCQDVGSFVEEGGTVEGEGLASIFFQAHIGAGCLGEDTEEALDAHGCVCVCGLVIGYSFLLTEIASISVWVLGGLVESLAKEFRSEGWKGREIPIFFFFFFGFV